MKKWILFLAGLIITAIILIYTVIPGTVIVSKSVFVKTNQNAVFRKLKNDADWSSWWPGTASVNKNGKRIFTWNKNDFLVESVFINAFKLNSSIEGDSCESILSLLPGINDTLEVRWQTSFTAAMNPITRIQQYILAGKLNKIYTAILRDLGNYISDIKNVYGFSIKEEIEPFENLMSAKNKFNHYPATADVYSMIGRVKNYIRESGGKETDSALLYVWPVDSLNFEAQVAIPVDKKLPATNIFSVKWMFKGGNIITCKVIGGSHSIDQAMQSTDLYVGDHNRARVAIPFQQLITNRLLETDTSKWVTKIYYPVI